MTTALLPTPAYASRRPASHQAHFAVLLQRQMSATDWAQLQPSIRARFATTQAHPVLAHFEGTMQWVYCSPLGTLIAKLLSRWPMLPASCGQNIAFDFSIFKKANQFIKRRRYRLDKGCFSFVSTVDEQPCLHEEFAGGLGMYLQLSAEQGALLFRDKGYFLRLGAWRIPLPRCLSVGAFELLHRTIDEDRFQVIIRVTHPLFGTLFYQRGEFHNAPYSASDRF
jgi:hypothetical protein